MLHFIYFHRKELPGKGKKGAVIVPKATISPIIDQELVGPKGERWSDQQLTFQ